MGLLLLIMVMLFGMAIFFVNVVVSIIALLGWTVEFLEKRRLRAKGMLPHMPHTTEERKEAIRKYEDMTLENSVEGDLPPIAPVDGQPWFRADEAFIAGLDWRYREMLEVIRACPTLAEFDDADRFMPEQFRLIHMAKRGHIPKTYLGDGSDRDDWSCRLTVPSVPIFRDYGRKMTVDDEEQYPTKVKRFEAQKELLLWINKQFASRGDPGRMVVCFHDSSYNLGNQYEPPKFLWPELLKPNDYFSFLAFYPAQPIRYIAADSFFKVSWPCEKSMKTRFLNSKSKY